MRIHIVDIMSSKIRRNTKTLMASLSKCHVKVVMYIANIHDNFVSMIIIQISRALHELAASKRIHGCSMSGTHRDINHLLS